MSPKREFRSEKRWLRWMSWWSRDKFNGWSNSSCAWDIFFCISLVDCSDDTLTEIMMCRYFTKSLNFMNKSLGWVPTAFQRSRNTCGLKNQMNCSKLWFQWNIILGHRLSHWMTFGSISQPIVNLYGSLPEIRPWKRDKEDQFAKDVARQNTQSKSTIISVIWETLCHQFHLSTEQNRTEQTRTEQNNTDLDRHFVIYAGEARSHDSGILESFMIANSLPKDSHPVYSPDFAPSNFWLFGAWRANVTECNSMSRPSRQWIKLLKNGCKDKSNVSRPMVTALNAPEVDV
jgi:hypothetical protein